MESGFSLSLLDSTTPIKIEANGDSSLPSSPSLQSSGDITAMVNTGGTPIASLRTPTKTMVSQNTTNKHHITLSPTRLYIKQDMSEYTNSSQSQPVSVAPALPTAAASLTSPSLVDHGQSVGSNNKLQFVRISMQGDGSSTAPTRQIITTQMRQGNAPRALANLNMEHLQPQVSQVQHQQLAPQTVVNRQATGNTQGQRVLLPAGTSQTLRISGSQSLAQIKSQLPPGTTILSSSDSSGQMLAFLPTSHTVIQKTPAVKQIYPGSGQTLLRNQEYHKPQPQETVPSNNSNPPQQASAALASSSGSDLNKQKKPCNCTKSQCLKLYCDCFANGEFCANCNCQNCYNNLDHEEERQKAVKQCLERNPQAFHPKIGKSAKADARRHQKGCNCKRSGCLKNYCECYEAKIPCGSMCKCVGCKNCEGGDSKGLMRLADAADIRQSQLSHMSHDYNSFVPETPAPHTYLKRSVIESIIDCLIAQCREAETAKCKESTTEKVILEEYGRCLAELIKASSQGRR